MSQTLRRSLSFAGLICVLVAPSRVTTVSGHPVGKYKCLVQLLIGNYVMYRIEKETKRKTKKEIKNITLELDCPIPRDFEVVVHNHQRTIISKASLKVYLDEGTFLITSHEATNSFEISADRVTLKFTGLSMNEYGYVGFPDGRLTTKEEEISRFYHDRLSGLARRAMPNSEMWSASDTCHLALLPTTSNVRSLTSADRLAREVRRLAEMCVQREVCPKILQIGSKSVTKWLSGEPVDQSLRVNGNVKNDKAFSCENMQNTINMLVDIGIGQLIRFLATGEDQGTVALPDLTYNFPSGSISLVNGTFSDIRTLKRRSNVEISHDGKKLTATIQLHLQKLVIRYKHYALHSVVDTNGHVTGSVAGATIAAQFSNEQKGCSITLDSLEVAYLGEIEVDLTGLGDILNSLVHNLSTWLTAQFHKNVVSALQSILGRNVQAILSSVDCEIFRA